MRVGSTEGRGKSVYLQKAVELELPQAFVRGLKPLGKIIHVLRIVLALVGFPGFTQHGKVSCVQLFLVVFREVPVLPDNPLQPLCPLTISLVVNWLEDLITLEVFNYRLPSSKQRAKLFRDQHG